MTPNGRRWTVMIVPDGCEAPRSLVVSERLLRRAAAGAAAALLVWLVAVGSLGAILTGRAPTAIGGAGTEAELTQQRALQVATLDRRLGALRDSLREMARRDERIRVLAGLPGQDSLTAAVASGDGVVRLDSAAGSIAAADVEQLIAVANNLSASFAQVSDTLDKHTARLSSTPSIMPTAGWLTSHFSRSRFHPILNSARAHEGIDVAAPTGTPIVAPAAGVVTQASVERGYGLVVEVDHGNGIVTKFAHCSKAMVRRGQRVTRGQEIAAVGSSGLSTGPHLHYEIRVGGRVVDPLTYVLPSGVVTD